jgi:selenide,water dikinase
MSVNLDRRRRVMARSQALGHCVCNPRNPCPCDIFVHHNVCPCAGEKMPAPSGSVPLTRHVRKAGCASKIGQADLVRVLGRLPAVTEPRVLVGAAAGDDAGVWKLDERTALVLTVDVFTPCVDDPRLFGRIAAANSVSDVYAMGGRPLTALSIVGFPIDDLDGSILEEMLLGGIEKLEEAACPVIGGHSINDPEIKLGFSVTGLVDPSRPVRRDRARPGDALVLTKPLGTGMVSFAAQIGRVDEDWLTRVGESMAVLNRDAAEAMLEHDAHACTDVTGFGLAGHLVEMVRGSGVSAEIDFRRLPVFGIVPACLEAEILSGAIERNQEYAMAWIEVRDPSHERNVPILYDPQTSGGLLVALPPDRAEALVEGLRARGHEGAAIVGRVTEREPGSAEGRVVVTHTSLENLVGGKGRVRMKENEAAGPEREARRERPARVASAAASADCCDHPPFAEEGDPPPIGAGRSGQDALVIFKDFLNAANQPDLIDGRAKKLMAIALSIAHRCRPCLVSHLRSAVPMGITQGEIDEAANLAVAFGGCTAMMFYREACEELGIG